LSHRWFCEGKELYNSPDVQIHCESGELHTLVIAEAFEDDTGRYTCLATNPSGSDSTSAEVFIEGKEAVEGQSVNGLLVIFFRHPCILCIQFSKSKWHSCYMG
jgi:hypothetical protein